MSRVDLWLYVAQRVSAMVLAPLVIVHLLTIIYAIQGGLTAGEILQRTQGSLLWGSLYSFCSCGSGARINWTSRDH